MGETIDDGNDEAFQPDGVSVMTLSPSTSRVCYDVVQRIGEEVEKGDIRTEIIWLT